MFQKDVSEVINKVSNIAGMIRARAPASDASCSSINRALTKKGHIYYTSVFFIQHVYLVNPHLSW